MMKLLIVLITGMILCTIAPAQTWNEFFKQKKTQKKYLARQIVLLHTYLGYVKKGYEIAHKGLTTIENIRNGDFNLHRDFFRSLTDVNPAIANSAKAADIIAYQAFIIRETGRLRSYCATSAHFTPGEVRYVARVCSNLLFLTDASVSELLTIVRSGESIMSDAERLRRLDVLHDDMSDKYDFAQSFREDVHLIALERQKEADETALLNKQYSSE